jgi:hypothetical protein
MELNLLINPWVDSHTCVRLGSSDAATAAGSLALLRPRTAVAVAVAAAAAAVVARRATGVRWPYEDHL